METSAAASIQPSPRETLDSVVIRFAGDSGDGMQLAGTQLTNTSALAGNDVATFPDFPAEIRAPAGTLAGVSGFQIHFASDQVYTPADQPDLLVAFNPAALRANEIDAEILIKATKVNGVFSADPVKDPDAVLMPRLTYQQVLQRGLRVMDAAAISLCMESEIPIQIFNIHKPGILKRVVLGEDMGSLIGPGEGV